LRNSTGENRGKGKQGGTRRWTKANHLSRTRERERGAHRFFGNSKRIPSKWKGTSEKEDYVAERKGTGKVTSDFLSKDEGSSASFPARSDFEGDAHFTRGIREYSHQEGWGTEGSFFHEPERE